MNWDLLALFAVVLAAVIASNIWLRRRAVADEDAEADPPDLAR